MSGRLAFADSPRAYSPAAVGDESERMSRIGSLTWASIANPASARQPELEVCNVKQATAYETLVARKLTPPSSRRCKSHRNRLTSVVALPVCRCAEGSLRLPRCLSYYPPMG